MPAVQVWRLLVSKPVLWERYRWLLLLSKLTGHPSTNPERLSAFNEFFLMLAALCAVAVVAAWYLREEKRVK